MDIHDKDNKDNETSQAVGNVERLPVVIEFMPSFRRRKNLGTVGMAYPDVEEADNKEVDKWVTDRGFAPRRDITFPQRTFAKASDSRDPDIDPLDASMYETTPERAYAEFVVQVSGVTTIPLSKVARAAAIAPALDHSSLGLSSPEIHIGQLKAAFPLIAELRAYCAIRRYRKKQHNLINNPIEYQNDYLTAHAVVHIMEASDTDTHTPQYSLNIDTLELTGTSLAAVDLSTPMY